MANVMLAAPRTLQLQPPSMLVDATATQPLGISLRRLAPEHHHAGAAAVAAATVSALVRQRTAARAERSRLRVLRALGAVSESEAREVQDLALGRQQEWLQGLAEEQVAGAPFELAERIREAIADLEDGLVERSTEVRIVLLAAFCAEHVLLLGPPGTAKSMLARRLVRFVDSDSAFFERLLTRFSVPEELFGPLSLKGLERDEYVRKTRGYLPEASVAFVDEIFKANSAILNSLLSIVNERIFDNGPERISVPLQCLVAASNEPPESEELDALYDRILFRLEVQPVSDDHLQDLIAETCLRAGRASVSQRATKFPLTLADAKQAREDAVAVSVPADVVDILRDARHVLASMEPPSLVSDRRLGQAVRMLQVMAWTCGRSKVERMDCMLLRHVLWKETAQREAFGKWLRARVVQTRGSQMAAVLNGLVDRVESGVTGAESLRKELVAMRKVLLDELADQFRQQVVVKQHCWLAPAEAEALSSFLESRLDDRRAGGARSMLLDVALLDAAAELEALKPGTLLESSRRLRRDGKGFNPLGSSESQISECSDETFKLGKHKGRLFSEVAKDDEDYCRMVLRKVEDGGFAGDTALDKQIRSFVAYLRISGQK